jgi:DNA-binding protein H-NS
MGIPDRLRQLTKKAENTAAQHKDQIKEAAEKAETTADQRSGGKYHEQIAGAATKAKSFVDRLETEPQPGETPAAEAQPSHGAEPPAGTAG